MPYRKNVFIVGAGFSAEAGAPVVRNFFERAMELWKDPTSPLGSDEREVFKQVYDYRQALEIAESRVDIDLDNIEDLFGVVEMDSQLGGQQSQETRRNLVYVILRTIELTAANPPQDHVAFEYRTQATKGTSDIAGGLYHFFVNVVARRWFPRADDQQVGQDSVISLNYDLLLERAMEESSLGPAYDLRPQIRVELLSPESPRCRIRLLKLHGSANWAVCPSCKNKIYILPYRLASVTQTVTAAPCESCGNRVSARLIVPPTWNKEEYRPLLASVWQSAYRELETAQRIFVIGYSMPEIDRFFQYLLALSLSKNKLLDEIVVVNHNPQHAERIAKLFRRLFERGRVFRPNDSFRRWVEMRGLQGQLRQIFPSDKFAW